MRAKLRVGGLHILTWDSAVKLKHKAYLRISRENLQTFSERSDTFFRSLRHLTFGSRKTSGIKSQFIQALRIERLKYDYPKYETDKNRRPDMRAKSDNITKNNGNETMKHHTRRMVTKLQNTLIIKQQTDRNKIEYYRHAGCRFYLILNISYIPK